MRRTIRTAPIAATIASISTIANFSTFLCRDRAQVVAVPTQQVEVARERPGNDPGDRPENPALHSRPPGPVRVQPRDREHSGQAHEERDPVDVHRLHESEEAPWRTPGRRHRVRRSQSSPHRGEEEQLDRDLGRAVARERRPAASGTPRSPSRRARRPVAEAVAPPAGRRQGARDPPKIGLARNTKACRRGSGPRRGSRRACARDRTRRCEPALLHSGRGCDQVALRDERTDERLDVQRAVGRSTCRRSGRGRRRG